VVPARSRYPRGKRLPTWPEIAHLTGLARQGGKLCLTMNDQTHQRSFGRTVLAVLVFLIAAWLLLGFIIHVVSILFSTIVLVLAVVAVVWALRILL
jgi:uncharacterized membrane protein